MRKVAHCPECKNKLTHVLETMLVTYEVEDIELLDDGDVVHEYTGDSDEHSDTAEPVTYEVDGKKYQVFECDVCIKDVKFHDVLWEEVE